MMRNGGCIENMYHYNEERIQEKLGYLTPKEFGVRAV
jgi:putative transposase